MRPWADNRKWPCWAFTYGDAGLAPPEFRIPIVPGYVFPGLRIEDDVGAAKEPVGRGLQEMTFQGPGLQIGRTINRKRAIEGIIVPICVIFCSVQVKAPVEELKATAMGVNDLSIDVKARVHIADGYRFVVLSLSGAGNEKNRDKADEYFPSF
jgi:hypothetical protein